VFVRLGFSTHCIVAVHRTQDGGVGGGELEPVPRGEVNVVSELRDRHGVLLRHGGHGLGAAQAARARSPLPRGDVVEHPHGLPRQRHVVGLQRRRAVEQQLLGARAVDQSAGEVLEGDL
jgi:hypothetical protein